MSAGASGSFAINGTEFLIQPSTFRWMPRTLLGVSGDGHGVYPLVREYEMRFNLTTPAQFSQLFGWFQSVGVTGTAVVDLPQYGNANYIFYSYSGCVIREPEMNDYFVENHTEVLFSITNIRT